VACFIASGHSIPNRPQEDESSVRVGRDRVDRVSAKVVQRPETLVKEHRFRWHICKKTCVLFVLGGTDRKHVHR